MGSLLYAKNTQAIMPIASITKLMTAMVVLDASLPLDEIISISREDVDRLKGTTSRLRPGKEQGCCQDLEDAIRLAVNRGSAISLRYLRLVGESWRRLQRAWARLRGGRCR